MFKDCFENKKVIITGHTGFKGAWLTGWLLSLKANVVGISIDIPTTPSLFKVINLHEGIRDIRCDVRNLQEIKKIITEEQPDFVFHLAAQPIVSVSYAEPVDTFSTNVMGTVNVLESLRFLENACTAVIITSDKCYDNVEWVWGYKETDAVGGKDVYSGSKGAAELVFKCYYHSFFKFSKNIRIASARAGNVIGGGDWAKDRIVPDCMTAWADGKKVEIRSPKATRPWQHVLEPLSGYLWLAEQLSKKQELHGESFNFGPKAESSHTVIELLEALSKYWKSFSSAQDGYSITDNIPFHEAGLLKLNCDKALYYLQWQPTLNYDELIEFTGEWYANFYQQKKNISSFTYEQINKYTALATAKRNSWAQ
jgi:CDP-glucose 4,6-dehydratase